MDGTQTLEWICRLRDFYEGAVVYFTRDGITTGAGAYYSELEKYFKQIRVFPVKDAYVKDFFFNKPPIGKSFDKRVDVRAVITPKIETIVNGEIITSDAKIRIDSIKTHTPDFTCSWWGGYQSDALPSEILNQNTYGIFIKFWGQEDKLYRDKLTIYYEGNITEEVNLIAGSYPIKTQPLLTITEPKPGEILTPCQLDTIKWKGYVPGLPTIVEYTINGGVTWVRLDAVFDSLLVWTVPNITSEEFNIRVRQEFKPLPEKNLVFNNIPFTKTHFSDDANYLLGMNEEGKIYHWHVLPETPVRSMEYSVGNYQYPMDRLYNFYVGYTEDNKSFVAAYTYLNMPQSVRQDTIAFFEIDKAEPIKKIAFPIGEVTKKIEVSGSKKYIAHLAYNSPKIKLLNSKTGVLDRELVFSMPVNDFSFVPSRDSMLVTLYDNSFRIINLKTFATESQSNALGFII